jgi:hypothetical protein
MKELQIEELQIAAVLYQIRVLNPLYFIARYARV